ncbi:hypothetical protein ACFWPX_30110 [Nocardia sp. NPDC058518]|uniref:hypothetical protein n=1 Tax=Nocardia sp. NPDC058518 TaxID=3346534 RepID=UPI0036655B5E
MKRLIVHTGADVRRWDTYEIEVPDDWNPDAEDAETEAYLAARIAQADAEHISTEYENSAEKYPPGPQDVTSWEETTPTPIPEYPPETATSAHTNQRPH